MDFLIDAATNTWNSPILYSIFNSLTTAANLCISLTPSSFRNKLIWERESKGTFNVSSAYRMIQNHKKVGKGESSRFIVLKPFCKRLGHMRIPHKTKIFAWRAYKYILPSLLNLQKEQILSDCCCQFCKASSEDTLHALFLCPNVTT